MLRRTIGISAVAAAISVAAIIPASAQAPTDGHAAGAKATAVDLTVFGEAFAVSATTAGVDSTPKAVADGNALITPGGSSPGAPAESPGADPENEDCTEIDLPSPINLASIDLVCVKTTTAVTDGGPTSSSTSNEVVIEIRASDLIATTPLADVVAGIQDGVGQLFGALEPVFTPLQEGTGVDVPGVVDSLLAEIKAGELLARITVAPTSSKSEANADTVSASATSNGVIVELLPNLPGGALAVVTVGSSTASVTRPVGGGAPTLAGSAAVLNVTYPNGQLAGLAALTDPVAEVLNTAFDQLACGEANPLTPVICFTKGISKEIGQERAAALGLDMGPSTVGQETSVLSLTLLSAAGDGGIELNVGHTAAAAGAVAPLPREETRDLPAALPRTGTESALPLTLALLAVGTAGAMLVRRSRTV